MWIKLKKNSLKINFIYQSFYQILIMITPLITAPYIARVIGASNVGVYSYTYTIVNYFVLFSMLGINNYGSREIAKSRENKKLNSVASSLVFLHIITTVVVGIFLVIYICFFSQYKILMLLQGVNLIASLFDITWLYSGLEKFKSTVTKNSIIKILTVILILLFVKNENDLWIYICLMAGGTLIGQLLLWPKLFTYIKFQRVDYGFIKKSIKPMFILFIAIIATSLYRTMDKVMLGNVTNMSYVGCYENADKLILFPIGLITALGTIMLPRMSLLNTTQKEKFNSYFDKSIEFSLIMSFALCFGLVSVSDNFCILFFGNEFILTGEIVKYLSFTIPIISFNNVVRTQYLIPKEKDKIYVNAIVIGTIINLVINYILIPKLNVYGAIIGTIVAYIIVFIYQMLSIIREVNWKKYIKISCTPFASGVVMYILVSLLKSYLANDWIYLIVEVIVGAIIYILINALSIYFNKGSNFHEMIKVRVSKYMKKNRKE